MKQSCLWSVARVVNVPQAEAGVKQRCEEQALRDGAHESALCFSASGQHYSLCHMWCSLCHHDQFGAKMNLVPEFAVPLSFPHHFHSVLPLITGDATVGWGFLNGIFPDVLMGDQRSWHTFSLVQPGACINMVFGVIQVQMSFMFCVSHDYFSARSCYSFPAQTFSSAHMQCSTSMERFHCSLWRSRSTNVLPPIPHLTPDNKTFPF